MLVVWLITGIWHGASWIYVAWGLFHAALLIGSQVFEPVFKKLTQWLHIDTDNFGWRFIQMTRTYLLCCIGRVFFRASSISNALDLFSKMLNKNQLMANLNTEMMDGIGFGAVNMVISLVAIITLWAVDMLLERMSVRETLAKQNLIFRWAIIFIGLFAVIIFGIYGPGYNASSFIYEQF